MRSVRCLALAPCLAAIVAGCGGAHDGSAVVHLERSTVVVETAADTLVYAIWSNARGATFRGQQTGKAAERVYGGELGVGPKTAAVAGWRVFTEDGVVRLIAIDGEEFDPEHGRVFLVDGRRDGAPTVQLVRALSRPLEKTLNGMASDDPEVARFLATGTIEHDQP